MSDKTLVIYHSPCLDGMTAAWAAAHALGRDNVELHPATYGDTAPDVVGRHVLIVDFSYPRPTVKKMHESAESLRVIDHHKTARADLQGLPYADFDTDRSGAGLTWDLLHPSMHPNRPWLVDHVEDRDLWKFALPGTKEINAYLGTLSQDLDTWYAVSKMDSDEVYRLGRSIVAYQDRLVESHVQRARMVEIADISVPCVNAPPEIASDLGNALVKCHPPVAFSASYYITRNGQYKYSLRSTDNGYDVSIIAKYFGGGGHRNASGFLSDGPVHVG